MGGIVKCENEHFHGNIFGCPICKKIFDLKEKLGRARKALEFYADNETWRAAREVEINGHAGMATNAGIDRGKKAKQALNDIKEESK